MKLKTSLTHPSPHFVVVVVTLIVALFFLAGCGGTPVADDDFTPTPVTFTTKVAYECGQPPAVAVVKMRDVVWDIITVEDVDLYTLTVSDYQKLGLNTSDWLAASKQLKVQRNFYRDCIARSKKDIENENLDTGLVSNPESD